MMQGRMWLESEVGKGSTFHFTAEFGIGADETPATAANRAAIVGLRVLIVDNNRTNRLILEETLKSWHARPTVVQSGEEALDELNRVAETDPYRVALVDYMMPEMDGHQLAQRIGQSFVSSSPQIIMISSAPDAGDSAHLRGSGIAELLTKPAVQSELLAAMLRVIGESAEPVPTLAMSSQRAHDGKLRTLVMEDGAINQRVATGLLESWGHDVKVAVNGKAAIDMFAPDLFDMVLMDIQIP